MRNLIFGLILVLFLFPAAAFCGSKDRIMVIANKAKGSNTLGIYHSATRAAVHRVESYLADKGLGVFDEEAVKKMYSDIELIGGIDIDLPDNKLIELALKNRAEVLVKVEAYGIIGHKGARDVSAMVKAKMFKTATGQLIARSEQSGNQRLPNPQTLDAALDKAASKAGARAGKRLYQKYIENLSLATMSGYIFVFKGFEEADNDLILEILYGDMDLGESDIKELKVTSRYLETELFFKKKFGPFVRGLKKTLKRKGIAVHEESRDSGKVVLVKPGSKSSGEIVVN